MHVSTFNPVAIGEVLAGKYRVERLVGVGGMGVVMAARHTTLDQVVAIKFLAPDQGGDDAVGQFLREARASALIDSDHVARVSDVDVLPNGVPYMVMEYLEGVDLGEEIAGGEALPAPIAVDYMLQALDAIAAAHQAGVVHRDLKPANLFLAVRPDGSRRLKVLDFGISRTGAEVTEENGLVGTPAYMSPEQIHKNTAIDHRADIWALGAILYELVSGRPPFTGTVDEILDAVIAARPENLAASCPDLPPGLGSVIHQCLARDPADRYASAGAVAEALAPYAARSSLAALPSVQRELNSGPLLAEPSGASLISSVKPRAAGNLPPRMHTTPLAGVRWRVAPEWTLTGRQRVKDWVIALVLIPAAGALVGGLAFVVRGPRAGAPQEAAAQGVEFTTADAGAPDLLMDLGPTPFPPASGSATAGPSRAARVAVPTRPAPASTASQKQPAKQPGKNGLLDTRD